MNGRLIDVAPSVPDPGTDLRMPALRLAEWKTIEENAEERNLLAAAMGIESFLDAQRTGADDSDPTRLFATQRPADPDFLARLEDAMRALVTAKPALDRATVPLVLRSSEIVATIRAAVRDKRHSLFKETIERLRRKRAMPEGQLNSIARQLMEDPVTDLVTARRVAGRLKMRGPIDFDDAAERSVEIFLALKRTFLGRLKPSVDLRTPWFGIRDQLDTSGCVGWAAADLLWRQRTGRLDIPSARFIWQAAKELDGDDRPTTMIAGAGTSLRAALAAVRDHGFALEAEIPSGTNELYRGSINQFYETIGGRAIDQFVDLGRDAKLRIAWLSTGRPIACTLDVGLNFVNTSGPDAAVVADPPQDRFRHAVTIVGYRFTSDDLPARLRKAEEADVEKPKRHKSADEIPIQYLIRNTAGTGWGDRGYAWIGQRELHLQMGECYGILCDQDDYQRLLDAES